MKKIIALLAASVISLSTLVLPASATTKSDLIDAASAAATYKYVKPSLENAARNIEITEEQADQLLPLVKEAAALFPTDNGPTLHNYGDATVEKFFDLVDQACKILGFAWEMEAKQNAVHSGDCVFKAYDANGKLIYEYDGDFVTDTSAVAATDNSSWIALGAGAGVMFLACVAFVVARKKVTE